MPEQDEEEKDRKHLEYLRWATDVERVLVMAENSESTDAIVLAGEVRRLRTLVEQVRLLTDQGIADGGSPVNVYRLDSALNGKHVID